MCISIPYLMSCSFNPTAVGKFRLATILLSLENLLNPRSRLALCECKLPEYDFLHVNLRAALWLRWPIALISTIHWSRKVRWLYARSIVSVVAW